MSKILIPLAGAILAAALPMAVAAQTPPPNNVAILNITGGVKAPDAPRLPETASDRAIPAIPVVYEDETPAAPPAATAAKPQAGS